MYDMDWIVDPERFPFVLLYLILGGLCMLIRWGWR